MKNFIATVLIIVSVFALYFYVYPTYQATQALSEQQVTLSQNLTQMNNLQSKTEKFQQEMNSLSQVDKTRVNEIIPDSFNLPHLTLDLNGIASQNGLVISSVKSVLANSATTQKQGVAPAVQHTDISISVTGDYKAFSGFLKSLENSAELFDVVGGSYKTAISTGQKPVAVGGTYTLTLRTYWLK